jgi:hypothetical protein
MALVTAVLSPSVAVPTTALTIHISLLVNLVAYFVTSIKWQSQEYGVWEALLYNEYYSRSEFRG